MKIIQLSEMLANKIAAGEVVERPAAVVKELIENSIDANSTWIKVEVAEAGLKRIKITDNGEGMSEGDCERCFLRHATSKIKYETDLFHIKTLGFRGEALASIASVSKLTIKTSTGNEAGTQMSLEGGSLLSKEKSDARKGTEILIEDLFFNTPARLKYMRTIHTELGHITDLVNRLALANPDIRFEVTHDGNDLFKTAGTGDTLQVISQVYGMNVAKSMLPISEETLDFSIKGYISKPEITRASRNFISIIINGRYIRSIGLSQAIIRAYHTLLPIRRFPIVILSIVMDPILVDVNVHPTKLEVRFSKEKELFATIEEIIRSEFQTATLIPEIEQKSKQRSVPIQHKMAFDRLVDTDHSVNLNGGLKERIDDYSGIIKEGPSPSIDKTDKVKDEVEVKEEFPRVPVMYPIGQLQGTYILAQNENGLYMIDQHAAQERIKYEFFKSKLGKAESAVQELLLPITFEFSKQEAIFIEQFMQELERVGLFFEVFGSQSYVIRSYPIWFPEGLEEAVIREMVDQVIQKGKVDIEKIREEAAILMACKGSIKANSYLNDNDMRKLLDDLRQTIDPFTCPHGRPVIVHITSYELEKMFKRVM